MNRVDKLAKILSGIKGSSFKHVKQAWIDKAAGKYPGMPNDLKELYRQLGYGQIGDSSYMIHVVLSPNEIYDKETAGHLQGVLIVGDDFAGTCDAYDAAAGWQFGQIGSNGRFERDGQHQRLVEFLLDWFDDEDSA